MVIRPLPSLDPAVLTGFCHRWKILKLQLLGPSFPPDGGEVTLVATFAADADLTLLDHVQMEEELGEIMARKVDLLSRGTIDAMRNGLHRTAYLSRIGQTVYDS